MAKSEAEGGEQSDDKKNGSKKDKKNKKSGQERRAFAKPGALARSIKISAERDERRAKNPNAPVDRYGNDAAPKVVAVIGPRRSGKSTLIRSLVRHYTRRKVGEVLGPMTMVSGKKRRLTFIEVSDDLSSIIDAAKVADLIVCVIDAHYGFEMETFEMLNIAAAHGMPNVMGVLTHLDKFRDGKQLTKVKKRLKSRFWAELYDGAKLFYFSGLTTHEDYLSREVLNLSRFISVTKYKVVRWRSEHPYVLADRVEDMTDPSVGKAEDRTVAAFGYVRGSSLRLVNGSWALHVAGLGDLRARKVDVLPDPCPPAQGGYDHPSAEVKKRKIGDKDRILYAPMSGEVDGIMYDKDAVYINLPDARFSERPEDGNKDDGTGDPGDRGDREGESMVKDLQKVEVGMDELKKQQQMSILPGGVPVASGRFFDDQGEEDDGVEESEEEDSDDSQRQSDEDEDVNRKSSVSDSEEEDEEEEEEEASGEDYAETKWKELQLNRAKRKQWTQLGLARYIYGSAATADDEQVEENAEEENEEDEGDFFTKKSTDAEVDDDRDLSRVLILATNWSRDEDACSELKQRRFATGSGIDGDEDEGDEVYGDFQDVETGEKFENGAGEDDPEGSESLSDLDEEELQKRREEKKKQFDAEYEDMKTDTQAKPHENVQQVDHERRLLNEKRTDLLSGVDEATRQAIEGILPGRYVRVELENVPVEFIQHFNPRYPVILGGLQRGDEKKMLIRSRVKRHRWKRGVLKSHDPIVMSIGWRRYQTAPVYSIEDPNKRQRFLKYTPEHMHCYATFWGFPAPPSTGLVACQSLGRSIKGFRVGAMGTVTDVDVQFNIVKKLKLVGEPFVVHKNTAFIKRMFNSELEVNKFVGASLRTVSGIRGTIKKALRPGASDSTPCPPGAFRATFEDKLLRSDLVFLRAWVPVDPKEYCSVATTLLEAKLGTRDETNSWRMRTTRELREAKQLPIPTNTDSLYKPIERETRRFNPMQIPKKLEEALPYASRPKQMKKKNPPKRLNMDRAVVMEPEERKEYHLMQMIGTVKNERVQKRKVAAKERLAKKRKELAKEEEKHQMGETKRRKQRYITEGLKQKKDRENS
ncbi:hypothetical protein NDN08_004770 [Rhodosorus marinus]|uniref:Bms1-type G domain-containing protein n=1 Tax=Rhodosorus marinus TaxID=101924 RepID=A0AAV8URF5_9RHOD|nr:hypothetical protein NDN08_004770 [Rhodosorus marinus]